MRGGLAARTPAATRSHALTLLLLLLALCCTAAGGSALRQSSESSGSRKLLRRCGQHLARLTVLPLAAVV